MEDVVPAQLIREPEGHRRQGEHHDPGLGQVAFEEGRSLGAVTAGIPWCLVPPLVLPWRPVRDLLQEFGRKRSLERLDVETNGQSEGHRPLLPLVEDTEYGSEAADSSGPGKEPLREEGRELMMTVDLVQGPGEAVAVFGREVAVEGRVDRAVFAPAVEQDAEAFVDREVLIEGVEAAVGGHRG